jgi:Transposase
MALTIVEDRRAITGGVDTHADTHVAAALDPIGGLLGVQEFPVTPAGYARLPGWLGGFGTVALVGIEGTGSYGDGLARHVTAAGVRVVEVDRSDRQDRRRQGKSDPLDAVSAGKVTRHRLNPGGNREANHALWRIVITRMSNHPVTRVYVERRTAEGLSKTEIIRCLKRYVAREVYRHLRADVHVWLSTSGFPALSAHVLVRPPADCHRDLEQLLSERFSLEHTTHTTLQVDHAPGDLLAIQSPR